MNRRAAITIAVLLLAGVLFAPTASEQYGAAAWRIIKTMMGTATCAPGSYCMWGGGIYYVTSITEAQDALDNGCGYDLSGSVQSGCIINLTKGLHVNGNVTLHLAGSGTPTAANGRAGVILRGTGGGTATNTDGNPVSGTIIKASGTNPIIDVGSCLGCMIENLTLAGEDQATQGIDFLDPANGYPTTRFVVRNVAMYEIDGYGIRTTDGNQLDTMLIENVSVRDSDGCFQQRNTQTVGVILTNFDCSAATSTNPLFDIQAGDFTLLNSYVGVKNNGVGVRIWRPAARVIVCGNQLELGTSTSAMMLDLNEGEATQESNFIIDGNHVVYSANGNTFIDVHRKGSLTITGNSIQDIAGGKTITSTIKVDENNTDNRLFVSLIGNIEAHAGSGGVLRPVRFLPTLSVNNDGLYPTLHTPIISSPVTPGACLDGELWVDSDAVAGSNSLTKCLSNAWVAL